MRESKVPKELEYLVKIPIDSTHLEGILGLPKGAKVLCSLLMEAEVAGLVPGTISWRVFCERSESGRFFLIC